MTSSNPHLETAPEAFEAATDPFAVFEAWFAEAKRSEINDPNAMTVATVDETGMPNARMVLLKGLDAAGANNRGFVFYTNFEGTKGREILRQPKVALLFHWKSLERQVRIRGDAQVVSDAEADQYFSTRPRLSQIGAWASAQSRELESRFALETSVAKVTAKYAIGHIPRPPYWSGFRIVPREIEFWISRPYRLHDRLVYRRESSTAPWTTHRLYP